MKEAREEFALFVNTGWAKAIGLLFTVLGTALTIMFGLTAGTFGLVSVFSQVMADKMDTIMLVFGPATVISAGVGIWGNSLRKKIKRFRTYVRTLNGKPYGAVKDLAESVGKSESFVRRDLKKMIKKKMFLEGHLDKDETCLIASNDAYEQYKETEKNAEELRQNAAREPERELSEEVKKVIEEGDRYIEEIRRSNDAIPGVEVSNKMYHLENVIRRIFQRVEQHPELIDDLHKFLHYYLPTTMKLLKAYEELDKQEVQGENITTAKQEIENTLDTINTAFENLLELKDFTVTPTLTFGAPQEEVPAELKKEEPKPEPKMDDSVLSAEERKMVDDFAKQIDIRNSAAILQYGAGTQKKMADFSEEALEKVRTKDLGEVGDLLENVVTELKNFDAEEERKGIMGFFKKGTNKLEALKNKYSKAEENVNRIVETLEHHQIQLMKDAAMLDKMYALNLNYFKELSMYILAGKKKLEEIRTGELPSLMAKAQASGLPEDAQAAKDLDSLCDRFEKKIHDLELTRMIAIQTAPQIRLVQGNDTLMAEKIQSTIVNTIPLWKSQMVIALGVAHSTAAAKAQREVTDMTNALLQKNAETLKMATVETARESERGVVDLETLKKTNETLISTFDEVMNIQREGREKRRAAEAEIYRLEGELKEKLLQINR